MIGSEQPRPEVEPRSMSIDEVLQWVDSGVLRVPAFQQPFSWTPEMMRELFESIDRGFPIGSLVFWTTDARIPTLDMVGALPVPAPPASGTVTYLLDGRQRLATLYSALRLPADHPREYPDDRKWWIYYDLSRESEDDSSFVHVPTGEPAAHLLPLRSIIRTMDFLAFAKDLDARARQSVLDPATMMRRAERLVQHVKSYRLSTLRVTGGTPQEAVTIFTRLNKVGTTSSAPHDEDEP